MNDLIIDNICQYFDVPQLCILIHYSIEAYSECLKIVKKHHTPDNWQALSRLINEPHAIRSYFIGKFKPTYHIYHT